MRHFSTLIISHYSTTTVGISGNPASLKEQSDPIRLDQLTLCDQYILRQRILPSYFFFKN
jgi:hypothetical protein